MLFREALLFRQVKPTVVSSLRSSSIEYVRTGVSETSMSLLRHCQALCVDWLFRSLVVFDLLLLMDRKQQCVFRGSVTCLTLYSRPVGLECLNSFTYGVIINASVR